MPTEAADLRLDFARRFLPESLAGADGLPFLTDEERRALNQIRAYGYLSLLDPLTGSNSQLFDRCRAEFERGFPAPCRTVAPPTLAAVLVHPPLTAALVACHLMWMTQRHYLAAMRDGDDLDPLMRSLLHHRWLSDVRQRELAAADGETPEAVDGYLAFVALLEGSLAGQVELDLEAFAGATGRVLEAGEEDRFRKVQLRSQRWTFLGSGMTHPRFVASLKELGTEHSRRIADKASVFC